MPHINWFFISSLSLLISTFFLCIILLKYGKNKIHRILLFLNLALFVWSIGALLASSTTNQNLSKIAWKIGSLGVTLTSTFVIHLVYILVGKFKKIVIFSYFQAILFNTILLTSDLIWKTPHAYNGIFLTATIGPLYIYWFSIWAILITFAHYHFIKFYLIKKQEQPQIKYYILALYLASFIGGLGFLNPFNIPIFEFGNFGITAYCFILTYLIFHYQFMGFEIVYRKGIFYSLFIAILSSIYLLSVYIAEWLFRGIMGYKSLFVSLLSALIIAIIFNPLRNKIQILIDKILLGKAATEIAQENELLKQELERSERLKAASTLALGLAHEIRNPLTTIKTFAEFLPEKYLDKDFINKFSKLIPSEVERINNIIHQLLTFSKPSLPSFKDTDIHGLIKDILGFLNSEFLKKKIRISEDYADSTLIIRIDPTQIKQALLNIVFNALDAMPNGGMLSMKTEITNDSRFKIIISDTGCGIPKEELKHIFDPFYSKKDEGTGLGLAIAHRIITNHGGTIDAESEMGKGTTFIITISLTSKISEISEE